MTLHVKKAHDCSGSSKSASHTSRMLHSRSCFFRAYPSAAGPKACTYLLEDLRSCRKSCGGMCLLSPSQKTVWRPRTRQVSSIYGGYSKVSVRPIKCPRKRIVEGSSPATPVPNCLSPHKITRVPGKEKFVIWTRLMS